jgi:hypothetical protein
MPSAKEKLRAAEKHLNLLQERLIRLLDSHPREPDERYAAEVTDLERQIAEITQDVECCQQQGEQAGRGSCGVCVRGHGWRRRAQYGCTCTP